ncbi:MULTISPECIES: hypothetical protein [Parafrankia]|uniref:hypothetical protein n=1 Tax=Parafrankia TaxID=2994362 RepID=UPI0010420539|nr:MULTISPECIES: hypothetical protein [Parafrankia]MBE3201633.1 hypothetical protein [Parafrankia sp. CH37]
MTVWAFRIERYDSAGNRLPPVAVEMRARGFEGSLSEGDEVRVAGSWKDGTIRAERIENLTTNSLVRKRRFPWKGLVIFLVLAFVLVAAFMVLGTVMSASDHQNWCDSARDAGIRPASC